MPMLGMMNDDENLQTVPYLVAPPVDNVVQIVQDAQ